MSIASRQHHSPVARWTLLRPSLSYFAKLPFRIIWNIWNFRRIVYLNALSVIRHSSVSNYLFGSICIAHYSVSRCVGPRKLCCNWHSTTDYIPIANCQLQTAMLGPFLYNHLFQKYTPNMLLVKEPTIPVEGQWNGKLMQVWYHGSLILCEFTPNLHTFSQPQRSCFRSVVQTAHNSILFLNLLCRANRCIKWGALSSLMRPAAQKATPVNDLWLPWSQLLCIGWVMKSVTV